MEDRPTYLEPQRPGVALQKIWYRVAFLAAGALAFAASGVSAQDAPGATAVVQASATILSPVAVQAPSSLSWVDGVGGRALQGTVEVRSPAPHVVVANTRSWQDGRPAGFGEVHRGSRIGAPQSVQVDVAAPEAGEPMRVTYVVAVIL